MSVAAADYHFDMDSKIFEEWFEKRLIPGLPPNSVIVIDNAPYHSRQATKIPCSSTKKSEILKFMMDKKINIPSPCPTKPILLNIIKEHNFEKEYVVDQIAANYGHTVLRLPPYFCVFNPIVLIWGIIKRELRKRNCDPFNTNKVCEILQEIVDNISPTTWLKCIEKCKKFEKTYRSGHANPVKPFIIEINDSDSE